MRMLALFLLSAVIGGAQSPLVSLMGTAKTIARDQIVLETGAGTTLLYADDETKVWRGQSGNVLTVVQPGDEIVVRYRQDSSRAVIVDLYANITQVSGRISAVTHDGFEVDQNFSADPQSRHISAGSAFRSFSIPIPNLSGASRRICELAEPLEIVGLKTASTVQATRVTVYAGNAPVRMPANARVIGADGNGPYWEVTLFCVPWLRRCLPVLFHSFFDGGTRLHRVPQEASLGLKS